ncbi:hypothetical protein BSL78_11081 [Apostichopus japonicus]|uniref:Immunoglobulin domain-containing protein n=1 Tax=Stichopus japonicus TaxID=307972 RepID=A0A2G8KVF9_STIJA|nr:hypothetical protein BSL78_11081 [Apostichopus japonicus]
MHTPNIGRDDWTGTVVSSDECQSPQYLQLGEKGTISCNYPGDLYGVGWFNSTNVTSNDRPFISLREGIISGPGYESGEYLVHPNGSLIITKVSTKHNHVFRLTTLATIDEDPIFEDVHVVVYDKPQEPYPTIDATGCNQKSLCFFKIKRCFQFKLNVLRVGEVLDDLSWKLRTNNGDEQISSLSQPVTTSVNELQSYRTVVDFSLKPSLSLRLFVCAARSNVSEVGNSESAILVESGTLEASSEPLLVTPNERVVMNCGEHVSYFVWKKVGQTEEIIAFGTKIKSEVIIPDTFTLHNSSLVINTVGNPTLGEYTCVYSTDGVTTKFTSTDVTFQEERRTGWIVVVVLFVFMGCIVVLLIVFCRRRRIQGVQFPQAIESWIDPSYQIINVVMPIQLIIQNYAKVDIQRIILRDSFKSVEDNGEAVTLSSGAVLPSLNNLKGLRFENENWQKWDLTKLTSILQYACHRSPPTEISFACSVYVRDNIELHVLHLYYRKRRQMKKCSLRTSLPVAVEFALDVTEDKVREILVKVPHFKMASTPFLDCRISYVNVVCDNIVTHLLLSGRPNGRSKAFGRLGSLTIAIRCESLKFERQVDDVRMMQLNHPSF